jgi:hypothetical protein
VRGTLQFNSTIIILLFLFHMLKKTDEVENENADVVISNPPEGAIDAEVTRIASENSVDPDEAEAAKTVPGASTHDGDPAGEMEV